MNESMDVATDGNGDGGGSNERGVAAGAIRPRRSCRGSVSRDDECVSSSSDHGFDRLALLLAAARIVSSNVAPSASAQQETGAAVETRECHGADAGFDANGP